MVAIVVIGFIALYVGILMFDAYLLSVHVPTLVIDPSNFGAWIWLIIAVSSVIAMGASSSKSSN